MRCIHVCAPADIQFLLSIAGLGELPVPVRWRGGIEKSVDHRLANNFKFSLMLPGAGAAPQLPDHQGPVSPTLLWSPAPHFLMGTYPPAPF